MRNATLKRAHLTSQFSVTGKDVNETFFSHERSHGGKVPINEHGRLDEAGWLWSMVVNREAPAMPTTLADAFSSRLQEATTPVFAAVAPSGAGKTYGSWQLGMSRYVDLLVGIPSASSVFSQWRQAIAEMHLDDKLLLQPGETVDAVPRSELNSRKALYHTWILFHAFAAMRGQCKTPGDWLFVQLYRAGWVCEGYRAARDVCLAHKVSYRTLKSTPPNRVKGQASLPGAVLVLDEASQALPNNDQPRFARLRDAMLQSSPAATARDTTARPRCDSISELHRGGATGVAAGAGAGAGAGSVANLSGTSPTEDLRGTLQTGLLGCLLRAVIWYGRRMIVMGTSFSFTHSQDRVGSGGDFPNYCRWGKYASTVAYMEADQFTQLSTTECTKYIRFYANLLDVKLDKSLLRVCQQLQGVWLSWVAALANSLTVVETVLAGAA